MKSKVPLLADLTSARVSNFCPLQIRDYGFVLTVNGVMVGKGVSLELLVHCHYYI